MPGETQRGEKPMTQPVPNLLQRTREVQGDHVFYRFGNGLVIKTEIFNKPDTRRISGWEVRKAVS